MTAEKQPFGFLLMDKPLGETSREVVVHVARRLREMGCPASVGHCGTLDPLATGLMVLAIGPATHLTPWFQSGNKRYRAVFRLGVSSESLDLETPLIESTPDSTPDLATVQATCTAFIGRVAQVPPKYSAIRVQGQRAYALARAGKEFELPPRDIMIHELNLLSYRWPLLEVDVRCSGGTYIRTLGDDLAQAWGTRAVMTELCRTGASGFDLKNAWNWEQIASDTEWATNLIDVATALHDMPRVVVEAAIAKRFRDGLISRELDAQLESLWQQGMTNPPQLEGAGNGKEILVLMPDHRPVGIAHRRSKPGVEDAWRIKLSFARWLEPDFF